MRLDDGSESATLLANETATRRRVEVSAARVDMHRLQELVRLYRMGTGVRERARLLAMSTRTERTYRAALAGAGLLEGDSKELPEADALRAAVEAVLPQVAPQTWGHKVDPLSCHGNRLDTNSALI